MKSAVFVEKQKIEIQEIPRPEIESGEVLLKVEYCGICGSDIHAYKSGQLYSPGTVMGHEFSGTIAEMGDQVEGFAIGDRVAVSPGSACRQCYYCIRGAANMCIGSSTPTIGLSPDINGAFAEYVRIVSPAGQLTKLSETVSLQVAALTEPYSVAMHSIRKSRFQPGDRILVIGAGPIGLAAIQLLMLAGAGHITVIEKSEARVNQAHEFGANDVLNPDVEGIGLFDKVRLLNNIIGPDIIFECAGFPDTFNMAVSLARRDGQVMVVSIIEQETPIYPFVIAVNEIDIKGCYGFVGDDFDHVIHFMSNGKLAADKMISEIISLDDIVARGFEALLESQDKLKILVKP
ncbi:MAG: zinc-dependent alcohol dehydrogenase [Planctomycetota bacterium]|jgi:(R,R)-butanediol dehydrogenase/meso-butanediol dehydrogenase/diacetyl reductase